MSLKLLRDRKVALVTEAGTLVDAQAKAALTAEQEARYAAIEAELIDVNKGIERAEALAETRRGMEGTAVDPDTNATAEATASAQTEANGTAEALAAVARALAPRQANSVRPFSSYVESARLLMPTVPAEAKKKVEQFGSFGEQLRAIAQAGLNKGGSIDNRLVWNAAASGSNSSVASEGGFLVQTDFSTALLDKMHDIGDILPHVRKIPLSNPNVNGIKLPAIDETSRVDGSRWGGVLAYWANEADSVNSTKLKFRETELSLKKLFALGYVTDELLADAAVLESIMSQAFAEELAFKSENSIMNGTGAGQPLGYLNSGAVIVVNKDVSQATLTLSTTNVLNMWARMPRRNRKSAVWIINQDVEPALYPLTLGTGTAVVLLYKPPGVDGNNNDYGTLLGRPVIPVEYASSFTNQGDIQLVDLSQYLMIDKGGPQAASSMHVRFLFDEMTFRFIYRLDGQPAWRKPLTPFQGTNTQSPFIVLQAR